MLKITTHQYSNKPTKAKTNLTKLSN